jgi:hypothetical protein
MPVTAEHLRYFKSLIEGEDVEPWHMWWPLHESELQDLVRTDYLKLKFEKVRAAATFLEKAQIPFTWSARGKRAARFADFDPSILGPEGLPTAEHVRSLFGGAVAAFEDGDTTRGEKLVKSLIEKLRRKKDEVARADGVNELELDAEYLLELGSGEREAGIAILRAVSEWKDDCLTDAAVRAARECLKREGSS